LRFFIDSMIQDVYQYGVITHCYHIDREHLLCPLDYTNLTADWYINHSCDPNCGCPGDYRRLVAIRDIEEGEEITYDYAMTEKEPDWSMKCKCGEPDCRKTITGNDWKIESLQNKYKGYFIDYIQKEIDILAKK